MRKPDLKYVALLTTLILLFAVIPSAGCYRDEVEESVEEETDERYTIESLFNRDELEDDHPYDMETIKDMDLDDLNWTNQDVGGDGKADWNYTYEDPETGENKTLRIIEGTFGGQDMLGGAEYTMYDKEDIKSGDLSDPRTINTQHGAILVLPHNHSTAEGDGRGLFMNTHGLPSLDDPLYLMIVSSVVDAFDAPLMLVGENETNWESFDYDNQDMITFVSLLPLFMQDMDNITGSQLKMFYPYLLLRTNLLGHTLFENLASEFGMSLEQGIFSEGASKQGYVRWFTAMLDDRVKVAQCDWFHLQDMYNATKYYYRDWGRPPIEDHEEWAYYSNEIATLMTSVSDSLTTLLSDGSEYSRKVYDVWDIHRQADQLNSDTHISVTGSLGVGEYDGDEWDTDHDGTYFPIGAESNFLNRLKELDIDYRYGMDRSEPLSRNAYSLKETRMFNNWFNSMNLLFEENVSDWAKVGEVETTLSEHNATHDRLDVTAAIENPQENMTVHLGYAGNSDRRWNDPEHDLEEGEYPWKQEDMDSTEEGIYETSVLLEKDVMYGYYVEAFSPGVVMYLDGNRWNTSKYDSSPLEFINEYEYELEGVSDMFVEDHALDPEEPIPGEDVVIDASVIVDRPDIYFGDEYYDSHPPLRNIDVEFRVNQELEEDRTITISEYKDLQFIWTAEEVGTFDAVIEVDVNDALPEFNVDNNVYGFEIEVVEDSFFDVEIVSPQDGEEYVRGETAVIEYTVENTKSMESTQTVEFSVDDTVEDSVEVTLGGGEAHEDEFSWITEEEGEFVLKVASEDDEDEVNVSVVEEVMEYELTINAEEGGTTDPEPDIYTYTEGEEVTVEAIPDEGWEFSHWEGDVPEGEQEEAEITIYMDGDKEITAHFEEDDPVVEYELTIESTEGGSVVEPGEGTFDYEEGKVVELEAAADEGYVFVEWTGEVENIQDIDSRETTITMEDDYTITAHFEEDEAERYKMTVNIEGQGEVELEPDQEEFEEGTEVILKAIPDEGHRFVGWTGDHEGTEEEITITVSEEIDLTANFELYEEEEDDEVEEEPMDLLWIFGILAIAILIIAMIVVFWKRKESEVEEENEDEFEVDEEMSDMEEDV